MATRAETTAARTVRNAAPGIILLARSGYAAKGLVYVVMGALAAKAAMGAGGTTTDPKGAVRVIGDGPFGSFALVLIGVGLLGYMVWRLVSAATDAEGKGDDATSLVVRAAHAARGVAYGALGVQALRESASSHASGGANARQWTAKLLDLPFGRMLVLGVGIGIVAYAAYQLYRASSDKVKKHLDLAEASASQASWIVRLGRFGIAARAVVFAMIGVFLLRAASQRDAGEAGGIAQSLMTLWSAPYGGVVLGVVALGLMSYGAYEIATARYRHIRAVG